MQARLLLQRKIDPLFRKEAKKQALCQKSRKRRKHFRFILNPMFILAKAHVNCDHRSSYRAVSHKRKKKKIPSQFSLFFEGGSLIIMR